MNALRGGALRDVYALLYQLEHDARRKGFVQVSLRYISKRLGYSERSVHYALSELKEKGLVITDFTDGRRSVYRTLTNDKISPDTPANIAPLLDNADPCKICTPANIAPLQNLHPTPANIAPPTTIINHLDNSIDYYSSSSSDNAQERLQKWIAESDLKQWAEILIRKSELAITLEWVETEFFNNDFTVREECEQSERMSVLKHFQNWLPKFLRKLKTENDNANNHTSATANTTTSRAGYRTTSLDDLARSIAAGFAAGAARRVD